MIYELAKVIGIALLTASFLVSHPQVSLAGGSTSISVDEYGLPTTWYCGLGAGYNDGDGQDD